MASQMRSQFGFALRAEHSPRSCAAERSARPEAGQLLQDRKRRVVPITAFLNAGRANTRVAAALPVGSADVVGPLGLEPRTKGFTISRRFRRERTISSPPSLRRIGGAGRSCLSLSATVALR